MEKICTRCGVALSPDLPSTFTEIIKKCPKCYAYVSNHSTVPIETGTDFNALLIRLCPKAEERLLYSSSLHKSHIAKGIAYDCFIHNMQNEDVEELRAHLQYLDNTGRWNFDPNK